MLDKSVGKIVKIVLVMLLACTVVVAACTKKSSEENTSQTTEQPTTDTIKSDAAIAEEVELTQTTEKTNKIKKTKQTEETVEEAVKQAVHTVISKTADVQSQPAAEITRAQFAPLEIKLPKSMFIGTPQNMRVPNLEKPLGRPRPPFLAPVGTKNVGFKKPVASSDEMPIIGEIDLISDGDKEATDGSYVELGPFLQNVTLDLGKEYEIYAILIWHFHKQPRVYFDVVVRVADDSDFITNVKTLFNNDHDNSSGLGVGQDMHYVETAEGKLIDAKGVGARYVRLYSNGNSNNDLNHYIEVEVHGRPARSL